MVERFKSNQFVWSCHKNAVLYEYQYTNTRPMFRQLRVLVVSAIAVSFLFVSPALAESIIDYDVHVDVREDGTLHVQEDITYDFGALQKHGIFREIPVRYEDGVGNAFSVQLENIEVKRSNSQPHTFAVRNAGRNKEIKIGDKDILITGIHKYHITYDVKRALLDEDEGIVLLWNIIGAGWNVPIKADVLQVTLPATIPAGDIKATCYTGEYESTRTCAKTEVSRTAAGLTYTFAPTSLGRFEGVTVNMTWPKGYITMPTWQQKVLWFLKDNWTYALPMIVLLIMFYLWYSRGRDPKGKATIITQFDVPEGLSPAHVGIIIDERVQTHDVSAEIIGLAIAGFINIIRLEKQGFLGKVDYELQLLKPAASAPFIHQKELLEALFTSAPINKPGEPIAKTRLSAHKNSFHEKLQGIINTISKDAEAKGYFAKNPHQVRATYMAIGLFLLVVGIPFIDNFVVIILNAGIVFLFSFIMPAKTAKGVKTYQHILGLKQYLTVAEKDRINFHNAPEKSPKQFEKFLPYAMVLGVEKEWEKQFKDIYKPQDATWFHGSPAAMTMAGFTRELGSMKGALSREMTSKPSSSSSGGFSGGGFGGGGGGSW